MGLGVRYPKDLSYDSDEVWKIQKYINQMKADVQSMIDRTVYYGTEPDRRRNRTW